MHITKKQSVPHGKLRTHLEWLNGRYITMRFTVLNLILGVVPFARDVHTKPDINIACGTVSFSR